MRKKIFVSAIALVLVTAGCGMKEGTIEMNFSQDELVFEYALGTINPQDYVIVPEDTSVYAGGKVIDLSVVGKTEVPIHLENKKYYSDYTYVFEVVDTVSPVIEFADDADMQQGSELDLLSVVKRVYDPVDGDLVYSEKAPESDTGWFTVTAESGSDKADEYVVKVTATDRNGLVSAAEKTITVDKDAAAMNDQKDSSKEEASSASAGSSSVPPAGNSQSDSKGTSSAGSAGTSGNSGNGSNSGSSGTANKPQGSSGSTGNSSNPSGGGASAAHTHDWYEITKTVHHNAVTHEESSQKWVVDRPAWDEQVKVGGYDVTYCLFCQKQLGKEFTTSGSNQVDQMINHIAWEHDGIGTYTTKSFDTYETVHHEETGHYETESWTVTDKAAYDETVHDYWICQSCGAKK